MAPDLPLPPFEMRQLVGPTDPAAFDNPSGDPVVEGIDDSLYASVLDFGCGCGRLARRLLQQRPVPDRYLGLDLHAGMIAWCTANLAPHHPGFRFEHHDVYNAGFNPDPDKPRHAPFPVPDDWATLLIACSVFTHILEGSVDHYLGEVARVLAPGGRAFTTWFLFDKQFFPMMQEFQNALYINDVDPTNAVIYDRTWFVEALARHDLALAAVKAPHVRGFQWSMHLAPAGDVEGVTLPDSEDAPFGIMRAVARIDDAHLIGRADLGPER